MCKNFSPALVPPPMMFQPPYLSQPVQQQREPQAVDIGIHMAEPG